MEKTANVEHEITPAIQNRKSIRAYSEKPVDTATIESILEAARWAPSSMNEQPWRYIVGKKNTEVYDKIFDALVDSNKAWVKHVPVLLVSLAKKTHVRNGAPNKYALHDTGAANVLLCVETSSLGLYAHQMGGFEADKLKKSFELSDDYEVATVIAVGYQGNADELPDALRERELAPRERYKQEELILVKGF